MNAKERLFTSYTECKKLLEGKPKNDSEAREKVIKILLKDLNTINNFIKSTDATDPQHEFYRIYLPLILTQIGIMFIEKEEFAKGADYLKQSIDSVEDPLLPHTVYISVETRNNLAYVLLRQSDTDEAMKLLKDAEKLYYDFRNQSDGTAKHVFEGMGNSAILGDEELEVAHTMSKFYLAQAYEVLDDTIKSSIYCHETLKRKLKHENLDSIDWAVNSALLCQFFLDRLLFKQGRSHLAAASLVLDDYENKLNSMEGPEEEIKAKKEELRYRSADLSWCWGKFGLFILEYSRYKLLGMTDDENVDEETEDLKKLIFDDLDLKRYEDQITDENVVAFEDAREVFLFSQKHFNKAKEYYTFDNWASRHVELVQNHSHLFKALLAFEQDEERQFKMLKKRADMLEVVLKDLSPRYYLDICQQLCFELGEIYHDMMQIKAGESEESLTPQALKKANLLIEASTKHFNTFLNYVKDEKTKKLPEPLPEDLLSPTLSAHFYLGRLYFKYMSTDKHCLTENFKKAYECLKYLVDYCERYEEAKAVVSEKYEISMELIPLLQMKVLQL